MRINVVVVDDEAPICEWLVYCIRQASEEYEVVSASNGEEAFALVLERKPDIVFTDIRMPGMDGLELMRRTLEVLPFTVFAILTNYAEFSYAKQALSLGAREYFLKSELRAADIKALLISVESAKEKITANKTQDTLSSGCIDLYNFYREREQPDYADRFWSRQGMWEHVPYLLLAMPNGGVDEEQNRLVALAHELRERSGGTVYTAVANEREYQYLIVQAEEGLRPRAERLIEQLAEIGGVGVSTVTGERREFPRAMGEAARALAALFFAPGRSVSWYETLGSGKVLDRGGLREQKRELLTLLDQRRYSEMAAGLEIWFCRFQKPAMEDMDWAVDYCRRMVLSVEERYYQEAKSPVPQMEVQGSLEQCASRCLELIARMRSLYSGRCSPSIETALDYIHHHYQEGISMAEVARQVYRSPEYFSRQFKEEVGENFSVYLTLYRLDRAQELLLNTDLRITEIAERVGYTTPGYFSRLYKKYKGHTPERERMSKT